MPTTDPTASFGYWMRRRRQALDLTQAELARRVGCATVTVSKMERDERRPSRQMAELLAGHLAVPAEQRERFLAAALGERAVDALPLSNQPAETPASAPPPADPPQLPTSLAPSISRNADESGLLALLENPAIRLVTITGPGGVGKTHLSLRVAEQAVEKFRDGAVFVALDATRNPEQVLTTIASTLGVRESAGQGLQESLLAALSHRRQLLVLDNFEQVLDAAELVNALVRACPHLKILVTSRERLGLSGEQLYPLKPLALPTNDGAVALSQNPAVQLFVLRARSVQPDFMLDDTTGPTVAAICAAVDGLPLAIELAAARLALFSLPSLLRELTGDDHSPLRLLRSRLRDAPLRHRSLIDAIQWSYDLLTGNEQRLFRRLAVFVGSFSLNAAQAIAGDGADSLEGVASLVAKNLLAPRPQADGSTRYAYLQTIRDAALALLEERGESHAIHLAHARWYAALAVESEEKIRSREQLAWLERMKAGSDNLHAAIGWCIDNGERDLALTFGESLLWFWWLGNQLGIGNYWMKRLLSLLDPSIPPQRQAKVRFCAGLVGQLQGEYVEAVGHYERAIAQAEEGGSPVVAAYSRHQLAWVLAWQRQFPKSLALFEATIATLEEHNQPWELALALTNLGVCYQWMAEVDTSIQNIRRGIEKFRGIGDRFGISWALSQLAIGLTRKGELIEAQVHAEESLLHSRLMADKLQIANSLSPLSGLALAYRNFDEFRRILFEILALKWPLGDLHGAVSCLGNLAQGELYLKRFVPAVMLTATTLRETKRMGGSSPSSEWMQPDEIISAARAALSPEEFAAAWAEGEARSLADVVEELLHPTATTRL